jgi:hypothetical protein
VTEQDYITGRKEIKLGNYTSYRTTSAQKHSGMPTTTTAGHTKNRFLSPADVESTKPSALLSALKKTAPRKKSLSRREKACVYTQHIPECHIENQFLLPPDDENTKPSALLSALKKSRAPRKKSFSPREKACVYTQHLPEYRIKKDFLSPADMENVKPSTLPSALKKEVGAKTQGRSVSFAPTDMVRVYSQHLPARSVLTVEYTRASASSHWTVNKTFHSN